MSKMTEYGDDDEVLNDYRAIVQMAAEGVEEYLAVVDELQIASIEHGKIDEDVALKSNKWAGKLIESITESMDSEGVVPHYYIAALIEQLHQVGYFYLMQGLSECQNKKFVEAFI
jgi:hypothetical protein